MPIHYFSDKAMTFHKREIWQTPYMPGIVTLTAADTPQAQNFLGFGVAITDASCFQLAKMERTARTKLLQDIYTSDGINLSVGRLCIGTSDYSAGLYSYDDVPFDTELAHFSIARDEAYIIPMLKEILEINSDLYLFASPWSPPGWMKTGGNLCGGYMREEYVECYAEYIIRFIKAYREHGIKISAITPQNEPETQQAGRAPACIWTPEIEAKFIAILRQKLEENNIDLEIWMYDHNFNGVDRVLWMLDNTDDLLKSCNGVAFHYYEGHIEQTLALKERYPELTLHFTEGGPRLYDHYSDDWCKWGLMVSKALRCGYSSFTGWNLLLDEMGAPSLTPAFCGGLVTRHSVTGELTYSGQYQVFRHIAPHINARSKIYSLASNQQGRNSMFEYAKNTLNMEGFMIDNGDQKPVFILVNPEDEKRQTQFYANGKWWYAEIMPESISTILF